MSANIILKLLIPVCHGNNHFVRISKGIKGFRVSTLGKHITSSHLLGNERLTVNMAYIALAFLTIINYFSHLKSQTKFTISSF